MSTEKRASVRPSGRPGEGADEVTVGTVIAGKYRIEARLGRGGMGTVWSCTHLALGDRMAVKIVSTSTALSQEVRSRFSREARASARLKSRFSVQVFDSGELPHGTPYIVMEYLEGETLRQHLRRVTRLSLPETVGILTQVARGLQRAHESGIVHRDIKPDNVFLAQTPDDGIVAKVFDFGVAKLMDAANGSETVAGMFIGTPQFMSPEQAMGRLDVDHRTDVYSLGVLAYRMLTGRSLFDTSSTTALLLNICKGPLPQLRDQLPDLPADVEVWFQRTCARDRDLRFGSASECAEALLVAAGMSISKLALPDSYVSGTHLARGSGLSTPVPTTELPRGTPVPATELPPGTPVPAAPAPYLSPMDPRSISAIGAGPSWRSVALVVGVLGAVAVLVISVVILRWAHEPRADGVQPPAAQQGRTVDKEVPPSVPAAVNGAPTVAPLVASPPAAPMASRPLGFRPAYSNAQTPHSATQPPAPKRQEPAPTPTSPVTKSANSAITDVGY